ncbi:hypothetical protein [Nocardioides taihuensis]|uniref:Sulfotransferase family protein n=1 Tax=Nocardioides taihuensis TaxID=1835606 RepID=A0ABW0BE62_9ACTN
MSRRVLLHVGTPKTGTSYLQDVLFRNQRLLRRHGMLYPAKRHDAHFLAALDLMRLPWGGLEHEAVGAWDRLAGRVNRWDGTAVISHEVLANASRAQVDRALSSLDPDTEVHLVLSVRDLARQIPAEWQENVKHRRELSYARFLEQLRDPERKSRIASWFWGVQEIPEILDRWGADLPPERVHLVIVPAPGLPPNLLWERFLDVFDLRGIDLDLEGERTNASLGAAETALVRRINLKVNSVLEPPDYRPLVRELLAHQTLSLRSDTARLTLPPDLRGWVTELSRSWVEELEPRGYDVHGDLDDLVGAEPSADWVDPDHPDEAAVADAGVDAIRALLLESARLTGERDRLQAELADALHQLERAHLRPTYRARHRIVKRLQRSRPGRGLLRLYRWARGRSSRSA